MGHLFVTPLSTGLLGHASVLLDGTSIKNLRAHALNLRALAIPAAVVLLTVALVSYFVLSWYHRRVTEQAKKEMYDRRTRQILYSDSAAQEGRIS